MSRDGLARWLVRLYPRAWRARYGDEFLDLVGAHPLSFQRAIDIMFGALGSAPFARLARSRSLGSGVEGAPKARGGLVGTGGN